MKAPTTSPSKLTEKAQRELAELTRLAQEAVRAAREENRRLGIPNVQMEDDGRITEELPDGTVRLLRKPE